jgi:formiminoglutamase
MDHTPAPLRGDRYACLGVQPHGVSREHLNYALQQGASVRWSAQVRDMLCQHFALEHERLARSGQPVYVTLDADAVDVADVPGVSAPNVLGLSGMEVIACARLAGESRQVTSFDLVEINPTFDRDGQSARWAALVIWYFLVGLAHRPGGR